MPRPDEIREWATAGTALKTEPGNGQKRTGFTVEQPSANVFNWVLNNIYRWIDYFDGTGSGGGFLYHEHNTSRTRVEMPFVLPASSKLSAVQVLRRSEVSVGGISSTAYSGDGTITAPTGGMEGSFSFTSSFTFSPEETIDGLTFERIGLGGVSPGNNNDSLNFLNEAQSPYPIGSFDGSNYPSGAVIHDRFSDRTELSYLFRASSFSPRVYGFMRIRELSIFTGSGAIDFIHLQRDGGGTFSNEFDSLYSIISNQSAMTGLYIIVYDSSNESNFVIYNLPQNAFNTTYSGVGNDWYARNISPVEQSGTISTNLDTIQFAGAYSVTGGQSGSGSSLSSAVTLDNSSPFNLAGYQYNPASDSIVVTLSGTVTATSFHTLVIRQNNQDILNLLSSAATYNSTDMTFTWGSISSDPLPSGGSVMFSFQTSGGGIAAYNFVAVTTGLSIETYSNKDYLQIGSASNVSNGDVLLIRKV